MSDASQFADIIATLEAKVAEAYERGRRDERARIERFLRQDQELSVAVQASMPGTGTPRAGAYRAGQRVAPGTIRPLVRLILQGSPGMTKAEIARRVAEQNPEVAPTSITNELQRNAGREGQRIYKRRADRWYLQEDGEHIDEAAGIAGGDHPPQMNGTAG